MNRAGPGLRIPASRASGRRQVGVAVKTSVFGFGGESELQGRDWYQQDARAQGKRDKRRHEENERRRTAARRRRGRSASLAVQRAARRT